MISSAKQLPDGWVEGFDSNYGRPYFFHKPTRRSSWTRPETSDADTTGFTTTDSPNTSSFRRSHMSSSFQSTASSPTQRAVGRFNEWLEVYSPEYNRTFFFNKVTRESTWVDPRDHAGMNGSTAGGGSYSQQHAHRTTMLRTEETPAAFLSIWESVGTDARRSPQQPADRPQSTPILTEASGKRAISTPNSKQQSSMNNLSASPVAASSRSVPIQQAFDEKLFTPSPQVVKRRTDEENPLAEELEMYARDLQRQNSLLNKHGVSVLDSAGRMEAEQLKTEVDDLASTAEALLRKENEKNTGRRGTKRPLLSENSLAVWGTAPPKVLDVKRAMQDVKSGMKYVKDELKAQKDASVEAEKVDIEGGYYTILGVPTNADLDQMKKAYRKAMIKCHPDKVPAEERSKAMEKSNMLQNAFNCLSDPWKRYLYDYHGLKRYLQNEKVIQAFKNYLLSGIELIKHPRKGYPRRRMFWITPDFEWIMTGRDRVLEPTAEEREQMKGVRIMDIHEISRGIASEVLERTGKPKKQSRYFSIVTTERTLDLEAESKERADFLVSRLSLLVLDTQQNRKWLLRHFELKALREAAEATKQAQHGYSPRPPNDPPPNPPPQDAGAQNNAGSNGNGQAPPPPV